MFWRKPVTHAAALWVLVGMAAGAMIAVLCYMTALASVREGIVEARPPRTGTRLEQPPTLFGTVTAVAADVIYVDSKQPYDEILVDADTDITTVGGSEAGRERLKAGTVVTATGKDVGGRKLAATTIVILQENR